MARASATPAEEPAAEETPAEETVAADPEPETATETPTEDAPAEEVPPPPASGRWRVLRRVQFEQDGNEFICGPGEAIDDDAAAQVDAHSIEPA